MSDRTRRHVLDYAAQRVAARRRWAKPAKKPAPKRDDAQCVLPFDQGAAIAPSPEAVVEPGDDRGAARDLDPGTVREVLEARAAVEDGGAGGVRHRPGAGRPPSRRAP